MRTVVCLLIVLLGSLSLLATCKLAAVKTIGVVNAKDIDQLAADAAKTTFFTNIKRNVALLARGSSGLVTNARKAIALRKVLKTQGSTALSFTEFKFLEQAKADLRKTVRLLATIPLSPEFFFYSYIVFPCLSSNNPWAWKSLPSTYDHSEDAMIRDKALVKRRMQTAVLGLHSLIGETADDAGPRPVRARKERAVDRIQQALQQKSLAKALETLEPWLVSDGAKAAQKLQLREVPGSVVKQCLRALGGDGVPNIPIVRRFNNMELNGRIRGVRASDEFLSKKGVAALTPAEVTAACFERCIGTEKRADLALRADLAEWVALTTCATTPAPATGEAGPAPTSRAARRARAPAAAPVANLQNKRLALMALHTVRNLKTSPFGAPYRALFSDPQ